MAFNSISYLTFLLIVVAGHHLLPQRFKCYGLWLASMFFYAQWNHTYLLLILFSTLIDFVCAKQIETSPKRKLWFYLSLGSNLGLLFTFKYLGFFSQMAMDLAQLLGRDLYIEPLKLLLPVGISFYTLQTLSYSIDVHRGRIKSEQHWPRFACYVSFFPQLVAGPIEKARDLLPQLQRFSQPNPEDFHSGCRRILWGLLKKTVIADRLSIFVEDVFFHQAQPNASSIFVAGILANVLIYADFSAYSDIAIGSARLLGIRLKENFNFPLFSTSMPDFWKRWHISLHNFFLDYVYYPLGGRRVSYSRWMFNIWVIFIVSGLWHGAAWNFVVWSIYHALLVIVHIHVLQLKALVTSPYNKSQPWAPWTWLKKLISISLVQCQRGLSMILFFIPDIEKGLSYLTQIFTTSWSFSPTVIFPYANLLTLLFILSYAFLMLIEGLHLKRNWNQRLYTMRPWQRWGIYQLCFFCIMVFGIETDNPFIYFQF